MAASIAALLSILSLLTVSFSQVSKPLPMSPDIVNNTWSINGLVFSRNTTVPNTGVAISFAMFSLYRSILIRCPRLLQSPESLLRPCLWQPSLIPVECIYYSKTFNSTEDWWSCPTIKDMPEGEQEVAADFQRRLKWRMMDLQEDVVVKNGSYDEETDDGYKEMIEFRSVTIEIVQAIPLSL
jgi:hypothetical protein